ncbi:MAG: S9 family peptidase [Rubrivivax sp.]|nr:S9 family peptidase [Rubrivivax sp.]
MIPNSRHPLPLLAAAALLLAACTTTPPVDDTPLAPPAAMRVEGVPPVPARLLEPIQRYSTVVGHQFVDWHPLRREMLVAHRAMNASTTQLFLLTAPMAPLVPLTDGADPVGSAQWEPREGRYIVFTRGSGGNEAYQLYRLDPATRAVTQITPDGQRHALSDWVRSRSLALVSSVPLDRTAAGGTRAQITTTLSLIDPEGDPANPASRRVVAELPGSGWFGATVSPDERQAAIVRYTSATQSEIWLVDLAGGERRRVLPAEGQTLRAAHFVSGWSPDGRALYVVSDRASEFRELMRLDLASGALARLTGHIPWDLSGGDATRDGRLLATLVNVDGRDELRLLDGASGRELPPPALPGGSVTRVGFHPASGELALVINSAQGPATIHTLDAQGRVVAWTVPAGADGIDLAELPEQRIVRWTSFDGRTISGVLSLPPARFKGPRPVLMLMHGGPEGQSKLGWNGRLNYLLQQRGIALLEPNVRGSTGYGKTFLDLDNGRLREDSVRDMGAALDWIATQPGLDAKRVVVMGGSYGGYMALAASVRLADRIAGAVSVVGISNFVSFLENTESYRRDLRRAEYGDERDPAMREFLQSISPLNLADRITKPLLVVQGKNDPRVPWTESEQIVRTLQARGTPVWYLLADNEGHGFARRENADFYFATVVSFLQRTLRP